MQNYLEVAVEAARRAGQQIVTAASRIESLNVEQKSLHDYVSEVDRESEHTIARMVKKHFPEHAFIGEEFGERGQQQAEFSWVVDPLDGTTNFLRAIPHYAVSIAIKKGDEVVCGVVYDPAKNELFSAIKGQGAQLNGHPLRTSKVSSIKGALLATGVPYSGERLAQIANFTNTMEGLLALQTSGIRRLGAAALDLAYVAAGRYEGFWESGLSQWDIAAGSLIVQEAGGIVSDLRGGETYLQTGDILASTAPVHSDMLDITKQHY